MTVTTIWAGRSLPVRVNDEKYREESLLQQWQTRQLFYQSIALNTIGTIEESSATEMAMLKMIHKLDVNIPDMRKDHLPVDFIRFHFTSKRKRMSTLMENCGTTEHGYDKRALIKGASEIVL